MAPIFNLLWHHAADGNRLLFEDHDRGKVKQITDQFRFGPLLYGIAFIAAFFNAAVSIGLSLAPAVFFALPERPTADSDGTHPAASGDPPETGR